MKVKCRGFEGELIDLLATIEGRTLERKYKILAYELRIALDNANLTLKNVKDEEIEFIKGVRDNVQFSTNHNKYDDGKHN